MTITDLLAGMPEDDALALLRSRPGTRVALVSTGLSRARTEFLRIARTESTWPDVSVCAGVGSERITWDNGSALMTVTNPRGYRFDAVILCGPSALPATEWAPALMTSCLLGEDL